MFAISFTFSLMVVIFYSIVARKASPLDSGELLMSIDSFGFCSLV